MTDLYLLAFERVSIKFELVFYRLKYLEEITAAKATCDLRALQTLQWIYGFLLAPKHAFFE